jgi:glutamyl-tRNA synthetase
VTPAARTLAEKLAACSWDKPSIAAAIKETLVAHGLKMPQLALPVRVLLMGTAQTPSLDAVLELMTRETVLQRLQNAEKNVL